MRRKVTVFMAVLVICVSVGVGLVQINGIRNTFAVNSSSVTVHYISVGHGDSIFIDTSNIDVLIDGGPPGAGFTVLDYLSSLNVTHIHLMVATHMHTDHIGGLVNVLDSTINVDEILINNHTYSIGWAYDNFMNSVQSSTITVAQRGQVFVLTETVNLTVLNPIQPLEFTSMNDDDVNNNSIVFKLQVGNTSFLFTGDLLTGGEQSLLDADLDLRSDVLKVAHHGLRDATTQPFLESVAASVAIISTGVNRPVGSPHQEVLQKLHANGMAIYGTHNSGTIVAQTDGTSIIILDTTELIPEFQSNIILLIFMTATLLVVIVYRIRK
jgi:competence protein ComEC